MKLFPAIDMLNNRAVRLFKGDRNLVTDYGNPIEMASKWVDLGAQCLHIVDLNGAFDDTDVNFKILKDIRKNVNVQIQVGGGIKSYDKIMQIFDLGIDRIILGSICVTNVDLVEKACNKLGSVIVGGLDAVDNKLKIKGWVEGSNKSPKEVAMWLKTLGVKDIIYTDISKDGTLTGVNINSTKMLSDETNMNIIASGGLSNISEIELMNQKNFYGVILGKALYNGNFTLKEALEYAD